MGLEPAPPKGESPEERRRRLAKAAADAAARNKGRATAGALFDSKAKPPAEIGQAGKALAGTGPGFANALSGTGAGLEKQLGGVGNWFAKLFSDAGTGLGKAIPALSNKPFQGVTNQQFQGVTAPQFQGVTNKQFQGLTNSPFQGLFGAGKATGRGANGGGSSVLDNYRYGKRNAGGSVAGAGEEQGPTSFMDFMAQLSEAFGAKGGAIEPELVQAQTVNYDPARNEAKASAAAAAQALAGIYQQLNSEFAETGAATDKRYADAQAQIGQNRDQAVQSTQDAYTTSQAQQSQMLNTLGIQNEAARAVEEGRDLAGRGAGAVAGLNSGALANQNYLASSGAGENRFNGRLQEAGQAAGARAQSGVQSSLASKLAEIAMSENQQNAAARQAADAANAQARQSAQEAAAQGGMSSADMANFAFKLMENQQQQERNVVTDAQNSLKGSSGANNLALMQQLIKQYPNMDQDLLKIYASVL